MMATEEIQEYLHRELGEATTAIGGHYALLKEEMLDFQGRQVLYLTGYALMDTTCCGAAGCGYAHVQGFVEAWRYRNGADGSLRTRLSLIEASSERKQIARLIREKEAVQQVMFRTSTGLEYLF
jgi:hypothetical protein